MKKAMLWMRDTIINTNIVRFYGLTDLDGDRYVIGDYCSKGTILDVIQNGKYNLTNDFKLSLAVEIASGMAFLHVNGVVHGMLTSYCCLLDNRWTVKISDWEYVKLLSIHNPRRSPLLTLKTKSVLSENQYEAIFKDFWAAPEILKSEFLAWPSPASDVYSYAIILQELFTREDPYFELADHMSPEEILHAIVHNRLRPEPSSEAPVTIRQIMELAWSDTPSARPTFEQITKMLRRSRTGRKTIMDNMMEAMEDYTAHLEEEMEAKESTILSVKSDLDNLMAELVPAPFMTSLQQGEKVESRLYAALGLVMMELVEGSGALQENGVEQAFKFLGALTSQLSQVIKRYDAYNPYSQVYQVQTYVLGFEKPHDSLTDRCHATAHLALDILKVVNGICDTNSPKSPVQVRLSAHVGSVATGTIGVTSPRFVLDGAGINAGRALLACSDVNVVKISRGLYSQIEKNPDFTFSSKDSEWITCNGIDIEAFVLTGRHNENFQISSDTSVDSGVYGDLSPIKSALPVTTAQTRSMFATKMEQAKTFLPSRTERRSEKSASFSTTDELQTTRPRRSKVNGRESKRQRATTCDHRLKGPSMPPVTEFRTAHLPSHPLSRISEQSDDSDTTGSGIGPPQAKTGSSETSGVVHTLPHRLDVQIGPPSSTVHTRRHHRHQRHHSPEISSVPFKNSHTTVHRDFIPEMSHGPTKHKTSHLSKRTITRSRSADARRNVSDSSCSDEDLDRKGSGLKNKTLKSAKPKRRRSHSQEPEREAKRHAMRRASLGSDVIVQDFIALDEGHGRFRTPKKGNKVYPM
ncbi:unnamed protein product [Lymnaea stagnalis]|uniref:guanylate cyclase n=1 Tax=Lymnaea stagnalis TaxID=6523 RepID=A0AAV2I5G8_LYMST